MAFQFPEWFTSKEASGKKHTSVGIVCFLILALALITFSGTQSQQQGNQNFSYGSNASILRQVVLLDPTSQNYYDKPNLRDKRLPQVMKSNNRSHRILKMGSMKKSWGKGKMGMKKKSKYSSSDCKPVPKWWNQRELMMGKKKKKESWGWSSKMGMMMKSQTSKKKGSSPVRSSNYKKNIRSESVKRFPRLTYCLSTNMNADSLLHRSTHTSTNCDG